MYLLSYSLGLEPVISSSGGGNMAAVQATLQNLASHITRFVQNNAIALLIFCIVGCLACLYYMIRGTVSKAQNSSNTVVHMRRIKQWLRRGYTTLINATKRIPVVGDLVDNLCFSYQCQEALSDEDAAMRTGQTLWWMLCMFIAAFLFGLAWFNDILLSGITAFILAHVVMTSLKSNTKQYLIGLNDAIEDFLLAYYKSSSNIDEAFLAVNKTRYKNPVAKHFAIMHEYVQKAYVADDPEPIQNEYNSIVSSRFLQSLFTVIYMTYKYGDHKEDGKSVLNMNIIEIQEQINDALYQQNKLLDETMGERWFIILPIYAIPLLRSYMEKYFAYEGFEYIASFLTSSTGYIVTIICAIITLICYLLYAQMVERGVLSSKVRTSWEKKALRNAHVRKFVLKTLPQDSPKRTTQQTALNRAGSTDSVNALQIRRLFLAVFLAIVSTVSVFANVVTNTITIDNDIYTGMARTNYTRILMTQDDMYDYIDEMLVADKAAIQYLRHADGYWDLDEAGRKQAIRDYLKTSGYIDNYRHYENYGIDRIYAKMNHLEQVSGLNNLLFVVLMTLFGYFAPWWIIQLKAHMNKDLIILDEVNDLQKSTIMLMNYKTTSPDSLLTWYSSSSSIMAPKFRECRVTKDFDALAKTVDYKPFVQLVTSLQMAFNGLSLREAFSGVEQRLLTQRREQSRVIEMMLKFRTDTIELMTSIAMGSVVALYMFLPLLVAMLQMFMATGLWQF